MTRRLSNKLTEHEVTPAEVYYSRRAWLKSNLALAGAAALGSRPVSASDAPTAQQYLEPTPLTLIRNYNNYYEYSFDKGQVAQLAQPFKTDPWRIEITGEIEKPGSYHLDELLKRFPQEERLYRFRCVEAWSMVIPWLGFALADLLKFVVPTSKARFVTFTSATAPEMMPNVQSARMLAWPYTEALRLDEALHPLTLLAHGLYGVPLANQNGAPLRLVVPWKYGFKSIKAIAAIHLSANQPISSWTQMAPDEYGFYANVNPDVPHPRWSQRTERLIGSDYFTPRKHTELFNGYAAEVGAFYANLDLRRYF